MDDKSQPTMITPEALLAAGYRGPTRTSNSPNSVLYQKTRYEGDQKLFFVSYEFWDFSHLVPDRGGLTMVEVDASLYIPMKGVERPVHARLKLSVEQGLSIADVEAFFLKAYETFGAIPDIHNNG